MIHPYKGATTGKQKTFPRFLRFMLAATLLSVAAGNTAHAFTFIEPGTIAIPGAAVGNPARNGSETKQPPSNSNPGVTVSTSEPEGGLRASLGPQRDPVRNTAADDAPSARALFVTMLLFAGILAALTQLRARGPVEDSPLRLLPVMKTERRNSAETLPVAGTVMHPGAI